MILSRRSSGILLHISSLPSKYGIGDFGTGAYQFADLLIHANQHLWQLLPLTPTDQSSGNSPYSSSSLMAGNTLFISPELLRTDGLLALKDLRNCPTFPNNFVDFNSVYTYKNQLFDIAFYNFQSSNNHKNEYEQFCFDNASWLNDYALFVALKQHFHGKAWCHWGDSLRKREPTALMIATSVHSFQIEREKFLQFQFFKQWSTLKQYCNAQHLFLIGDAPIYCSHDSADVWANPELFNLDSHGQPISVAGVPPDYFSPKGQRWGNPLYNWEELKKSGYNWWIKRLEHNFNHYDAVRIDHFRGLVAYWEISAKEKTAINGRWKLAPAEDFLMTITQYFKDFPVIAEDLGTITPDVKNIMEQFNLPGMKVLQFAFGDSSENPYLPHNYNQNSVVYSGTHDNNSTRGWYDSEINKSMKKLIENYIGQKTDAKNINNEIIRLALSSVAKQAIIPLQDVLGLGEESRMNTPSTPKNNWQWRVEQSFLRKSKFKSLLEMTKLYGRA
ncbi:MAG: 4-alpha-glucanotransferase [Bacteroidetes bacterium]|nr:4-alpha-glucanotransferase [Bacteroidota bacterium]